MWWLPSSDNISSGCIRYQISIADHGLISTLRPELGIILNSCQCETLFGEIETGVFIDMELINIHNQPRSTKQIHTMMMMMGKKK